jgi:hypothetical protein
LHIYINTYNTYINTYIHATYEQNTLFSDFELQNFPNEQQLSERTGRASGYSSGSSTSSSSSSSAELSRHNAWPGYSGAKAGSKLTRAKLEAAVFVAMSSHSPAHVNVVWGPPHRHSPEPHGVATAKPRDDSPAAARADNL